MVKKAKPKKAPRRRTKKPKVQTSAGLTPKMMAVLQVALEGELIRTISEIAKVANVRRQTIYEWLKKGHKLHSPAFIKAWNGLYDEIMQTITPLATQSLRRLIAADDPQSVKLVMELAKKYKRGVTLDVEEGGTLEALVIASMNGDGSPPKQD